MVDLKTLSMEQLSTLINCYPWFAAARKELCNRTGRYSEAALYVVDRRVLAEAHGNASATYVDTSVEAVLKTSESMPDSQKVIVIGGDYFSQDAYDSVRQDDYQNAQRDSAQASAEAAGKLDNSELVTETLASIYVQQGYPEIAKDIYSKLILRYPEKSAYFASLIEKLNIINNQ